MIITLILIIIVVWLLSIELRHHRIKELARDVLEEADETVRAGYKEIRRIADKSRAELSGIVAKAKAKK